MAMLTAAINPIKNGLDIIRSVCAMTAAVRSRSRIAMAAMD